MITLRVRPPTTMAQCRPVQRVFRWSQLNMGADEVHQGCQRKRHEGELLLHGETCLVLAIARTKLVIVAR
jgi:hypothetical protein